MNLTLRPKTLTTSKPLLLTCVLLFCVALRIGLDFIEAEIRNTSFYLSESFFFSSFWWLFPLFLYGQSVLIRRNKMKTSFFASIILPAAVHLLVFPAAVWILSYLFYYHTFLYGQTLRYGLTEHLFLVLIVYTIPPAFYISLKYKVPVPHRLLNDAGDANKLNYLASLVVVDGDKRVHIVISDILFFSANTPYVNIHHKVKKYIYNSTLKSLSERIDGRLFVRIHKSFIVNLAKVQSYKSRLNGDYDVVMQNGTELRLSRNYAADFKSKFERSQQDTLK